MQVSGIVTDVSKQISGSNRRGAWTMQWIDVQGSDKRIKIWTRPDLDNSKGKFITIDGLVDSTDKDKKPCLELPPEEGSIQVVERQPGTQSPASAPSVPSKTVRTIDDYESVLRRAIGCIATEFRREFSDSEVTAPAVAQVITSYMAAYVRGDFAVPADDADGEKIPF